MSFDGIVTKSVVKELREKLIGGRVDKVYQQEKDEILFH
ncbi:NFACT family protein, partial [Tissierella praeacuta]